MAVPTLSPTEESDLMKITPMGSGQEVGRSCHIVSFKDKKIMLDCGIHPGLTGMDALPFVDMISADDIDLLLHSVLLVSPFLPPNFFRIILQGATCQVPARLR